MKHTSRSRVLIGLLLLCIFAINGAAAAPPREAASSRTVAPSRGPDHADDAVLTRSYNNQRTGAALNETILTTSNVNAAQFGKIFTRPIDGQMYATPLFVPELVLPGKGTHNVIYVATQKNKVYAFDADDPAASAPLWSADLGPYGVSSEKQFGTRYNGEYRDILPYVGITSTPVIDLESGTIYVVAFRRLALTQYEHRLYALDIRTGVEKNNVKIEGSVTGTSPDNVGGVITFKSVKQLQRVSLLLQGGVVYLAFAGYADTDPYHGWIFGYDAATLDKRYTFNTTPDIDPPGQSQPDANDGEGGIWMSGQGISTDDQGDLYMVIGNGNFNANLAGGRNYGNGIVRIRPYPITSTLQVQTWFTPYNYIALNQNDQDLGVSGALVMPGTNLVVAGSKEGKMYVVNRTSMGGLGVGNDNQIVQNFLGTAALGNHIHGSLVYWNSPAGPRIYQWGEKDRARSFLFNTGTGLFNPTPTHTGSTLLPNGMPGGILSLSANNSVAGSGILWATHPEGDANNATKPGVLRAYNAENLAELWNSKTNAARDTVGNFAKFNPPMVANGRVYIGNFSTSTSANTDQLVVYGLLAPSIVRQPADQTVDGNTRATLDVVATGAGPLSYQWFRGTAGDTSNPVTGATTSTLVTAPIAATTRFWVRVTNSTSSVNSDAAIVTPYFAPSITTQPASQEIATGATASLTVVAAGSGPFTYQWFRGASGNTSTPIAGATSSSLTTPAITQVSQFWVRVSDGLNSVNSAAATLTPYTPLSITTQPADRVVAPGATASLSVVAAGSGPFTYQWFRGLSGDTSSPVAGATGPSLTTPAITQASRFWVRVSDGRTTLNSRAALVSPRVQVFIPLIKR